VRDVCWRPSKESNYEVIASGGDVIINFFYKNLNRIKLHYCG